VRNRFRFNRGPSWKNPDEPGQALLTEGILDANVETTPEGDVRVALWREWRAMLDDLRSVGPVWTMVRNGHSVLAVQAPYPELIYAADQQSAGMCNGERSLTYYFPAWHQAVAFDANCCCGRIHGLEIENRKGDAFHRICLTKGSNLGTFAEWVQMHQANGMETEAVATDETPLLPLFSTALTPGTLQFPPELLRTVLITAAHREIQMIARVSNEGMSQTARIEVIKASEAHGWLALSGNQGSLYVTSEPTGTLLLEPGTVEGESLWRLSLVGQDRHRLLRLQAGTDSREAWNQLIREIVLCTPGQEL